MVDLNRRSPLREITTQLARRALRNVQIAMLVTVRDTRRRVVCHPGADEIEWPLYLLTPCGLRSKVYPQVENELGKRF